MTVRNLFCAGALCIGLAFSSFGYPAGSPSKSVSVSGAVTTAITYSPQDLERFPSRDIVFKAADGDRKYTGVLLRDVIAASKPVESDPFALRQSYLIAKGSDGYYAIFSWAELFITPIGDEVLVIYKRDGIPLSDSEGLIATVSPKDTRPGPRYVKWLNSLELRRAGP